MSYKKDRTQYIGNPMNLVNRISMDIGYVEVGICGAIR